MWHVRQTCSQCLARTMPHGNTFCQEQPIFPSLQSQLNGYTCGTYPFLAWVYERDRCGPLRGLTLQTCARSLLRCYASTLLCSGLKFLCFAVRSLCPSIAVVSIAPSCQRPLPIYRFPV